jgi:hypothetical protein
MNSIAAHRRTVWVLLHNLTKKHREIAVLDRSLV